MNLEEQEGNLQLPASAPQSFRDGLPAPSEPRLPGSFKSEQKQTSTVEKEGLGSNLTSAAW
jgi:hypothetical protein